MTRDPTATCSCLAHTGRNRRADLHPHCRRLHFAKPHRPVIASAKQADVRAFVLTDVAQVPVGKGAHKKIRIHF
jgi:hypothetical protein